MKPNIDKADQECREAKKGWETLTYEVKWVLINRVVRISSPVVGTFPSLLSTSSLTSDNKEDMTTVVKSSKPYDRHRRSRNVKSEANPIKWILSWRRRNFFYSIPLLIQNTIEKYWIFEISNLSQICHKSVSDFKSALGLLEVLNEFYLEGI